MNGHHHHPDDCGETHPKPPGECEERRLRVRCGCECHGEAVVHVSLKCDCGGPVRPCDDSGPVCPPPPPKRNPGIVDLPDQPPPFHPPASNTPSWKDPDR